MALIDLDLDAPPSRSAERRPPPWRYRHLGLAMAAVLLLALGGATPGGVTFWRELGLIPAEAGIEGPIQLAGGRAFTVGSAGQARTLTAWALEPEPHRLWTAPVPITATFDPANGGMFGLVRVERIGDLLLLTADLSSTVLDAETGRVRWTSPVRVAAARGGTGLVIDRIFRPGTVYDQDSGDAGKLYFSADGQPHTEPPIRTEVRGMDLASGAVLWTATPGGSVTAEPVAGDRPAVLITASDRMTLRDARTGAVLRETALPQMAGTGPGSSEVLDDVALIGYPEARLEVGYDAHTLNRLWTRDLHAGAGPVHCAGLLCSGEGAGGGGQVRVLDRRTGQTAWSVTAGATLAVRAGWVLESEPSAGAPARLLDAATGASRLELRGWAAEVEGFSAGTLLMWRPGRGGGRIFGTVLPGDPRVRTLGAGPGGGRECGGDERFVVCRDLRGLRVWAYRL